MSILSNTIKVNFPKVKNLSLIVLFLELIKNKTCWFNEERVFFFFFFMFFVAAANFKIKKQKAQGE